MSSSSIVLKDILILYIRILYTACTRVNTSSTVAVKSSSLFSHTRADKLFDFYLWITNYHGQPISYWSVTIPNRMTQLLSTQPPPPSRFVWRRKRSLYSFYLLIFFLSKSPQNNILYILLYIIIGIRYRATRWHINILEFHVISVLSLRLSNGENNIFTPR